MKTQNITDEQALIYKMLTTSTGEHFLDSGGESNRHWQKNRSRTIENFLAEDEATLYISKYENKFEPEVSISLFHYLSKNLQLNKLCHAFNAIPCENWESDLYGVSKEGHEFLQNIDAKILNAYNSFNWDSPLSQVIQYTFVDIGAAHYLTLQIHGGCDVRGGYTDAKLFRIDEAFGYETASFELTKGDHRLTIDYGGGDLETYTGQWTNRNLDLDGALAEFGEGEHKGVI